MIRPLVEALRLRPLERPPVWIMRQAGRYLPEYREVRERHSFREAVATPDIAAELTLQPVRRFGMDGAVIFADIMTPLEAMGVEVDFAPGPKLEPMTLAQVADLPVLDVERVGFVARTVERVKAAVPESTGVIGFCGAPTTLLAYLLEGGGSRDFLSMRSAVRSDPTAAEAALTILAESMNRYLRMQIGAGADVVQLFDTWAGLLDVSGYERFALPAARSSLASLDAPTIYFAPGAGHTLHLHAETGADGIGVDWRTPIDDACTRFEDRAVQGNLDPAVLLTDPDTIAEEVDRVITRVGGRSGHVFNLGHGIDRRTPPENVAAMVKAVRG